MAPRRPATPAPGESFPTPLPKTPNVWCAAAAFNVIDPTLRHLTWFRTVRRAVREGRLPAVTRPDGGTWGTTPDPLPPPSLELTPWKLVLLDSNDSSSSALADSVAARWRGLVPFPERVKLVRRHASADALSELDTAGEQRIFWVAAWDLDEPGTTGSRLVRELHAPGSVDPVLLAPRGAPLGAEPHDRQGRAIHVVHGRDLDGLADALLLLLHDDLADALHLASVTAPSGAEGAWLSALSDTFLRCGPSATGSEVARRVGALRAELEGMFHELMGAERAEVRPEGPVPEAGLDRRERDDG